MPYGAEDSLSPLISLSYAKHVHHYIHINNVKSKPRPKICI